MMVEKLDVNLDEMKVGKLVVYSVDLLVVD
jgi:hypothetical protein